MTETDILTLLAHRYRQPEHAFFSHVRSAAGFNSRRTMDGLAMGLWPSRGLDLTGFEIKTSRSDWLRELRNPAKVEESGFGFCDRWYVVATPDVVKLDELPHTWGLMVVRGSGNLYTQKGASLLKPKPIDRQFLAVLLKRLHQEEMRPEALKVAFEDGKAEAEERLQRLRQVQTEQHEHLRTRVLAFEKASGVKIDGWDTSQRIGEAVRLALDGEVQIERYKERLRNIVRMAEAVAESAAKQLED